jgi:uncharacterized protein DUF6600/FecR-like protein
VSRVKTVIGSGRVPPGRRFPRPAEAARVGVLLGVLSASAARAAEPATGTDYGRVRHAEGAITAVPAGSTSPRASGLNRPIVPGDRLEIENGHAEIVLADSTIVWIDHGSIVQFRELATREGDDGRSDALDLRRGRLRIETPGPDRRRAPIHVDTAAGSINLRPAGSFRIEAQADVTHLASFGGVAEVSGDEGSVLVRGGQSSSVPIHGAPTSPRLFNTEHRDAFDRYHDAREAAYVDPGEPGIATAAPAGLPEELSSDLPELAYHGTWHSLPRYGVVWRPHSASGWSPFENGFWERYPAGWVWVSQEPWGWAPYRYGRWDHAAAVGWFWIPGRMWSGGWVAFAVGASQIGWCPLDYWNQPAFHEAWSEAPDRVAGSRLDPRVWHFAPINRFGSLEASPAAGHGPPPATGSTFVITRTLPAFDPVATAREPQGFVALQEMARRTRGPTPAPCPGTVRVPFRMDEASARRAPRPGAFGDSLRPIAPGCPPAAPLADTPAPAPAGPLHRPLTGKPHAPPPETAPGTADDANAPGH